MWFILWCRDRSMVKARCLPGWAQWQSRFEWCTTQEEIDFEWKLENFLLTNLFESTLLRNFDICCRAGIWMYMCVFVWVRCSSFWARKTKRKRFVLFIPSQTPGKYDCETNKTKSGSNDKYSISPCHFRRKIIYKQNGKEKVEKCKILNVSCSIFPEKYSSFRFAEMAWQGDGLCVSMYVCVYVCVCGHVDSLNRRWIEKVLNIINNVCRTFAWFDSVYSSLADVCVAFANRKTHIVEI